MMSLFYIIIALVLQQSGAGTSGPPPPSGPGNETNAPGFPIDENIWILVAMGIILGFYIIYKKSSTTNKAS